MPPMTWYEIIGDRMGWYRWCQCCYQMRWFHRHVEKPHPMFCVQHGGSPSCEAENRKYGFTCPKCSNRTKKPDKSTKMCKGTTG